MTQRERHDWGALYRARMRAALEDDDPLPPNAEDARKEAFMAKVNEHYRLWGGVGTVVAVEANGAVWVDLGRGDGQWQYIPGSSGAPVFTPAPLPVEMRRRFRAGDQAMRYLWSCHDEAEGKERTRVQLVALVPQTLRWRARLVASDGLLGGEIEIDEYDLVATESIPVREPRYEFPRRPRYGVGQ